jgi:protein-tyrosine-phosphatase
VLRPEARVAADVLGLDLSQHRAKELTPDRCLEPDLVLAMSWDQISHIWSLVPEAWDKVFTIKEFVHWAQRAPVRPPILFPDRGAEMRDKIIQAHAIRKRARADHGFWGGIRPQDLNLIEPNGKGEEAWTALGHAVRALVGDVVLLLRGPAPAAPAAPAAKRAPHKRKAKAKARR